jgi:hypothetical protein
MRRTRHGVLLAPDIFPPSVIVASDPPPAPSSEPPPVEIDIPVTLEPEPTFLVSRARRPARMLWFAFGALFVLSASSPWVAEGVHEAVSAETTPHAGAAATKPPCVLTATLSDAYNSAFSSK